MSILDELHKMGVRLPEVPPPVGSYIPAVQSGDVVWTSGQLPMVDGQLLATGKVPSEVSVQEAQVAARSAAINALAAVASVVEDLQHIERILRVCVYVNSDTDFSQQPAVANGASDFLKTLFGERGRHVRSAVGVSALPLNAAVELELVVQCRI